jgi:DNA-binding SARP family transcriptional activator
MTRETAAERPLEFRVLGNLEGVYDGRPIDVSGSRQRALLAVLLLRANEMVSRDRLIDELWGEMPPATAANALAALVARLRKALPPDVLLSRPGGYELRIARQAVDLHRFETLADDGSSALAAGDPAQASDLLRAALSLWRGPALAEFEYAPFAQAAIVRLEELRLVVLERRIEADLVLGRHGELAAELQGLVAQHPLRDRLRGQLMLTLYRSGRQAEALEVYRTGRQTFIEDLGIEPSPELQELERAILRQDASIGAPEAPSGGRPEQQTLRAILVAGQTPHAADNLLALAAPLARGSQRELVLVLLVRDDGELGTAAEAARERREALSRGGITSRAAAFVSTSPGEDIVRLVSGQNVDLALVDALGQSPGQLGGELAVVLDRAPCDIGVLVAGTTGPPTEEPGRPVLIPFGGSEHEWAAMEIGAWLASAAGVPLKLVGSAAHPESGRPDASRLLASASLALQQAVGIAAEPLLVPPGADGVIGAASDAAVTLLGLPERWRAHGLGETRREVVERASTPALLVRGGVRPGGLAPHESLTRYTWTLRGETS